MNPSSTPAPGQTTTTPGDAQRRALDKTTDPDRDRAASGAALPPRSPQQERTPTDSPFTPKEASIQSRMRLPHERDEDTAMTDGGPAGPRIAQAAEDLAAGRKDTSRANETDQAYHRLHEGEGTPSRPPGHRPRR